MKQDASHHGREFSPTELVEAGLRTFFNIARAWCVTSDEMMRILGVAGQSLLDRRMTGQVAEAGPDIRRVSNLLGIFKAINTLLPVPEGADAWLRAPNSAPQFEGQSAIDRMTDGNLSDLSAVRQYLDGQLG
jgi:hypothetical protein